MSSERFCSRPNKEDLPSQWKIFRVPKTGLPTALVLSEDTEGAYVHYWKGRTRPCFQEGCEPCEQGNEARWRGYVAVLIGHTRMTRILELTVPCIPEVERYMAEWRTLRGAIITLSRKGKVSNGELECVFSEKPVSSVNLPDAPDLVPHLRRIWKCTHTPLPSELSTDARTTLRKFLVKSTPIQNGRP